MTQIPEAYREREAAFVKHTILRSYLQRLFLIIGRSVSPVINYVDCFSGPWKEGDEKLNDTSIGVSLDQIAQCSKELEVTFGRKVKFRALYIEKNVASFAKLKSFLAEQPHKNIETMCMQGDYTEHIEDIIAWCGGDFTFFFVDPTGWKGVVDADTLQPLLRLPRSEFLINLMYDFINRAYSIPKHADDMETLLGESLNSDAGQNIERKPHILNGYRNKLNQEYKGRTTFVPINRSGTNRVLYFLVYLTRDATGMRVFKEESEKMKNVQRVAQQEIKLRQQSYSGTDDMFGGEDDVQSNLSAKDISENIYVAKRFLLSKLTTRPLEINREVWADFLEDSNLYPSDLQGAMKSLVKEGAVENLDASVSRRTKYIVKADSYPNKGERWVLTAATDY